MFCKYCGSKTKPGEKYCGNCGGAIPQETYTPPQTYTPMPPQNEPAAPTPYPYGQADPGVKKKKSKGALIGILVLVGILLIYFLYTAGQRAGREFADFLGDDFLTTEPVTPTFGVEAEDLGGIYGTDILDVDFRDNYTTVIGNNLDQVTVMVYMVGSDLETDGGHGTSDIDEMLGAKFGDNVNVILQTGGAKKWWNSDISSRIVQRWQIADGNFEKLEDVGQIRMLTSDALLDFVNFSAANYPADRYILIFWDHGGGSLYGFGYDELYEDDVLLLPDISRALEESGLKFDIIGFDACLMGTLETAYALEPVADYMIASEEYEPVQGWDYRSWLTYLSGNTSYDSVELGAEIVDSFERHNGVVDTLSVISLREIPYVYNCLVSYMDNATTMLADQQFNMISSARADTRSFAGEYDLIDIVDFVEAAGIDGGDELTRAIGSAVKYRNDCQMSGINGLAMYFPYSDLEVYGTAKAIFSQFDFGGQWYGFYDDFVSILGSAQMSSNGGAIFGGDSDVDYSEYDWFTESDDYAELDYEELEFVWSEEAGVYMLPLTAEDWDLITAVEMQILLDDGEGYIDLGSDQYWVEDDDGNLLVEFDNTWVAIDGQVVPYYAEDTIETRDGWTFTGYVPAELNGKTDIEIILKWTDDGYEASVVGYRHIAGNSTQSKIRKFVPGDEIEFCCDFYDYNGEFVGVYYYGEPIVIGDELPSVTYEDIGPAPVLFCYLIIDIYQNYSWTESIELS